MSRTILFEDDLKKKVLSGIELSSKAVGKTLGPHGRLAMIEIPYGMPRLTKDGVSVSKQIVLKDPYENMGAQLIKEVCSEEDNNVGDGTTTASILASAFCHEGYNSLTKGVSVTSLKKGMEDAVNQTIDIIKSHSKKISSIEEIKNVSMVSSNSDEKISNLITEAFECVGEDGIITTDESKTGETYLEKKEGMIIDKGLISPYFVNNEHGTCEINDSFVLITDETISNNAQIAHILNFIATSGKPFFIIAEDIVGEALPLITVNTMQGKIRGCAIKAPSYGQYRKDILNDIAIMTNATVVSKDFGLTLNGVNPQDVLGNATKVIADKDGTIIVTDTDNDSVENRKNEIRNAISNSTDEVDTQKLKERLANLCGGICSLQVYAKTEAELNELKDRVTDTISSVRSSLKDGIVCGGGSMYAYASCHISPNKLSEDEIVGFNIVKNALTYPLKTLVENADMNYEDVSNNICKLNGKNGYNVLTRTWDETLYEKVVDPVAVEVNALKNALSICELFLNSDVGICEEKTENKE